MLKRHVVEVDSPWGKINGKKVFHKDGFPLFLPEYEVCREIALKNNLPLGEVFRWIMGLNNSKSI